MEPTTVPDDWRIPDSLWEILEIFIPEHVNPHPFGGGRPRTPDRVCADAIFFVLRTGCQWKALDATKFCPGSTAHDRFQEWVQAGVFFEWWKAGLLDYDYAHGIDWSFLSLDGCMTKAPLGGKKTGPTRGTRVPTSAAAMLTQTLATTPMPLTISVRLSASIPN